jgi:hypothetical protein
MVNDRHAGNLLSKQMASELKKNLKQIDLSLDLNVINQVFEEGSKAKMTEREKLVYELITSERDVGGDDVTLNEILGSAREHAS